MSNISGSPREVYFMPFLAASLFGIVGTFIIIFIKEEKGRSLERISFREIKDVFRNISFEKDFMKFSRVSFLSNAVMTMLLPVISIMTIQVLNVDKLTFAFYGAMRARQLKKQYKRSSYSLMEYTKV